MAFRVDAIHAEDGLAGRGGSSECDRFVGRDVCHLGSEFQAASGVPAGGADRGKNFPVAAIRIARRDLRCVLVDGLAVQDEVHWTVACTGAEVRPGEGGRSRYS